MEDYNKIIANNKEEIKRLKNEISLRKENEVKRLKQIEKDRIVEEERQMWVKAKLDKEEKEEIERSIERFGYIHGKSYKISYRFVDNTNTKYLSYRINN